LPFLFEHHQVEMWVSPTAVKHVLTSPTAVKRFVFFVSENTEQRHSPFFATFSSMTRENAESQY
jgi:hypothetical protein